MCWFSADSIPGGKSSVLLDVKPWDDETDMKKLEEAVRSVQMEGLFWGACMLFFSLQFLFFCLSIFAHFKFVDCFYSDCIIYDMILDNKFQLRCTSLFSTIGSISPIISHSIQ